MWVSQVFSCGFFLREVVCQLEFEMMVCSSEVGAVRGQVGIGNLGEARADYVIEGARVEQRRPSSEAITCSAVSGAEGMG
jgi:hypothetical protein